MKVPVQVLLKALPVDSSLAAAIALTAIYGLLSPMGYAYFAVWKYAPYLDAAMGSGGKFLGFLLRSIFLVNSDTDVYAASTVLITAGMSACSCAQAAVLGDWFNNAAAAQRLRWHREHPRALPAACRLMAIPLLAFGPCIGVPAAVLFYGTRTPDAISTALLIRKYSAWGTLTVLCLLCLLAALALALAAGRRLEAGGREGTAALIHVLPTLASLLLLAFSGAARVRALYQRSVTTSDQLYYPLIVAPELLQQLLISVPTLLHRSGLAESYTGWRCKIWAWVACAFPTRPPTPDAEAAGAAPGKAGSECAESHGSKVSGECGGVPNEPGEL